MKTTKSNSSSRDHLGTSNSKFDTKASWSAPKSGAGGGGKVILGGGTKKMLGANFGTI